MAHNFNRPLQQHFTQDNGFLLARVITKRFEQSRFTVTQTELYDVAADKAGVAVHVISPLSSGDSWQLAYDALPGPLRDMEIAYADRGVHNGRVRPTVVQLKEPGAFVLIGAVETVTAGDFVIEAHDSSLHVSTTAVLKVQAVNASGFNVCFAAVWADVSCCDMRNIRQSASLSSQSRIYTVSYSWRQNIRPLADCLERNVDSLGSGSHGPAKEFNSFSFLHTAIKP